MTGMLEGKRILIFGVASKRSIAWGIARAMHREGATLAFTYQNERLADRVVEMAAGCDTEADLERVRTTVVVVRSRRCPDHLRQGFLEGHPTGLVARGVDVRDVVRDRVHLELLRLHA